IQTLTQAMNLPSPENEVTEASLEALGYLKNKEARELIRANLPYGHPTRVRVGCLKGYIRLGSLDDEDVRLLKEIALKDKDFVVRDQLLETVAEQDSDNRNRRRAVELLQDFARADEVGGTASSLRQDVEKLRSQNQELA